MNSTGTARARYGDHRIPVSSGERVEVVDAEIVTRDRLRAGLCGACGGTFDTDQMVEFTLRSTRLAEVTALLHGTCAVRLLEHTPVDLSAGRLVT